MNKNFKRITGHLYNVKNQNGFNNALYDYFDVDNSDRTKKEIRSLVKENPPYYPISFVIIDLTFECNRLHLEFFDIQKESKKCYTKGFFPI